MNYINYRVYLDMFDVQSQTTIKAKKGDSACKINITLTKHGKIYNIGEGCHATFNAKKADGNFIYDSCTIEGDTIVYDFASSIDEGDVCQVTACEGNVECEVTLYKGSEKLTSSRFTLAVDGTVYNGEEIASATQSDILKELIDEASATAQEALDKSNEANNKYDDCVEAYDACVEATENANASADELENIKAELAEGGYITGIKDINNDIILNVWIGTKEEYNALTEKPQNCYIIITDDDTLVTKQTPFCLVKSDGNTALKYELTYKRVQDSVNISGTFNLLFSELKISDDWQSFDIKDSSGEDTFTELELDNNIGYEDVYVVPVEYGDGQVNWWSTALLRISRAKNKMYIRFDDANATNATYYVNISYICTSDDIANGLVSNGA